MISSLSPDIRPMSGGNGYTVDDGGLLSAFGRILDIGVITFDENLRLRDYNDVAQALFDIDAEDPKAPRTYSEIITYLAHRGDFNADTPDKSIKYIMDSVAESRNHNPQDILSIRARTPKGLTLNIRQIFNTDGSLIITVEDITEQVRQRDALKTALRVSGSGYWYYSLENEAFEAYSHYFDDKLTEGEREKIAQGHMWSLIHPNDPHTERQIWKDILETKSEATFTTRLKIESDDALWIKNYILPQCSETGKVVALICFFIDVTDTLAQQDALRSSKEDVEKALKVKSDFLARISHEIRTPMNAVIGVADALLHHNKDLTIKPELKLIENSATNILRLLDDTLHHTKLEASKLTLEPKANDPATVVKNIYRLWEYQAQKNNIQLSYVIKDNVPKSLIFDALRFEQCLNNLISNAIKFAQNGSVKIMLTVMEKPGRPPQLAVAVKDTGIGMTQEEQKRIFDPYTQADETISRRFGGTGLGMNITQEIVKLMGGRISIKSEKNKGALFIMLLPLITDAATVPSTVQPEPVITEPDLKQTSLEITKPEPVLPVSEDVPEIRTPEIQQPEVDQSENASINPQPISPHVNPQPDPAVTAILQNATAEPAAYSNLKILVADDNATNHLVVKSLLESVVGEIFVANNGRETIDILEIQDIDIVLMDIHMPVMDGIEATLAIRSSGKSWADVLIIALTADPQYQQQRLCVNIGMDYALPKPVKLTDLLEAFDSVQQLDRSASYLQKLA